MWAMMCARVVCDRYDGWDVPGDAEQPGFAEGYLLTDALAKTNARPSLIPSLCTPFTRAGIEWRR